MHEVDLSVGNRIRLLRRFRGLTQRQVAERLGIRFQQVQKYERGINRISASRLWELARVLDVPVASFFEGSGETASAAAPGSELLHAGESAELLRVYYALSGSRRRCLLDLVRSLGETAEDEAAPEPAITAPAHRETRTPTKVASRAQAPIVRLAS